MSPFRTFRCRTNCMCMLRLGSKLGTGRRNHVCTWSGHQFFWVRLPSTNLAPAVSRKSILQTLRWYTVHYMQVSHQLIEHWSSAFSWDVRCRVSKRQQVKQRCHDMSCGMVWLRRMLTQILNPIPSCEHVNACKYRYVYNEMKSAAWSCSKNTYVQSKLHNHQKTCMENACFFSIQAPTGILAWCLFILKFEGVAEERP